MAVVSGAGSGRTWLCSSEVRRSASMMVHRALRQLLTVGEYGIGLVECKPMNAQNLLHLNNVLIHHFLHVLVLTAHRQGVHTYLLTYLLTKYLLHGAQYFVRT